MRNTILIICLTLVFSNKVNSQQNNIQAAFYNISLGSITSSIGAAINKKPNQKLGKVMLKGFWQGALGGSIIYGSKQMIYSFNKSKNLDKIWTAKLVNSIGTSMIENAALNTNFYDKWHINIGFNRLEINLKNNFKFNYKILPTALVTTIISATHGKLNLKYSTQTLTPIFISDKTSRAFTIANSIVIYENELLRDEVLAHEIIHVFQFDDYLSLNVYFNRTKLKWQQKSNFIDKSSKWIYMDLPSSILLRSSYLIENINQDCYFDNYFEHEANYYSNKHICR
jgi:hypothetical protein